MLDKMKTKKDSAKNFIRVNDEANDSGSDDEPGEILSHFYSSQHSHMCHSITVVTYQFSEQRFLGNIDLEKNSGKKLQ